MAIGISPFQRRWFCGLIVVMQLPFCWALIVNWRMPALGTETLVWQDARLLVSILFEACSLWIIIAIVWRRLAGHPTAWFAELRLDPGGLHLPGFLRRPLGWSEIAQVTLAWRIGMPSVVVRLRQLPNDNLVLRRGAVRCSEDRCEIRFSLVGWTLGAEFIYAAIEQRWRAFGGMTSDVLLAVDSSPSETTKITAISAASITY